MRVHLLLALLAASGAAVAEDVPVPAKAICVIEAGDERGAVKRLDAISDDEIRVVPMAAPFAESCSLVVLPSEWARSLADVNERAGAIDEFVRTGGALLVFQPNPLGREFPGNKGTFDLLGAPFSVDNFYVIESRVAVQEHPLVDGIDAQELPHPTDRITQFDEAWTELVRGTSSGNASLLAGTFGCGRAAVDTANPAVRNPTSHSDRFLANLLSWLRERGDEDCRPSAGLRPRGLHAAG